MIIKGQSPLLLIQGTNPEQLFRYQTHEASASGLR